MTEGGDGLRRRNGATGACMRLGAGCGASGGLGNGPRTPAVTQCGLRRNRRYDRLGTVEYRRAFGACVVPIVPRRGAGRRNGGMIDIGMPGGRYGLSILRAAVGAGAGLGSRFRAGGGFRDDP